MDGIKAWWDSTVTGDGGKGGVLTFFESVDMDVTEAVPNDLGITGGSALAFETSA